jgi:hypothetical protein
MRLTKIQKKFLTRLVPYMPENNPDWGLMEWDLVEPREMRTALSLYKKGLVEFEEGLNLEEVNTYCWCKLSEQGKLLKLK